MEHGLLSAGQRSEGQRNLHILNTRNSQGNDDIMGMCSLYMTFIPEFTETVTLLCALVACTPKKSARILLQSKVHLPAPFIWDETCEDGFKSIIQCLTTAHVLTCPDVSLPFTITPYNSKYDV